MTINRAPWTALVDDDGSNLVGSIWNKAAIKTVLLDPIDTATLPAPLNVGAQVLLAINPGTVTDWAPAGGIGANVWLLNPLGATDVTGILAEPTGTMHLLMNISGTPMTFYNQHASSAAANRFVGPGFANYVLGVWASVWILYTQNAWVILKA